MRLVLLPGMDGTGRLFGPLLAALPPGIDGEPVAYPRDEPLGYEGLLPVVEAAAVRGGDFVVVGESFSGPLAIMLAARRPPGLRGVVLCASFIRFPLPVPPRFRGAVRAWMFRLQPLGLVSLVLLGRRAWGGLGAMLRDAVRSVSPEVLAARALAVAGVDVTAELRACPVPVLSLRAAGDLVVRRGCAEAIRAARPATEEVVLPGPHLVLQASPREAAAALAAFCRHVGER